MNYPILMADVVNSSNKNPKELIKDFKLLIKVINKKWKNNLLSPLTITLGDEFQGVIDTLENGMLIIFDIEETIIQLNFDFKLRFVLNFGEIDTKINKKIAYEMLGSGLTNARKSLTLLKKEKKRFEFESDTNTLNTTQINNSLFLYEAFIDDWNKKDLKTVSAFLTYRDYKKVAEIINTDISSAWRRNISLKINEYFSIKEIILYLFKINQSFLCH